MASHSMKVGGKELGMGKQIVTLFVLFPLGFSQENHLSMSGFNYNLQDKDFVHHPVCVEENVIAWVV